MLYCVLVFGKLRRVFFYELLLRLSVGLEIDDLNIAVFLYYDTVDNASSGLGFDAIFAVELFRFAHIL